MGGRIEKTRCLIGVVEGRKEEVPRKALGLQVWGTGWEVPFTEVGTQREE